MGEDEGSLHAVNLISSEVEDVKVDCFLFSFWGRIGIVLIAMDRRFSKSYWGQLKTIQLESTQSIFVHVDMAHLTSLGNESK